MKFLANRARKSEYPYQHAAALQAVSTTKIQDPAHATPQE
eukprot:SAG11_NODE_3011_length_2766_cov_2.386577_2_plen_40_part_00